MANPRIPGKLSGKLPADSKVVVTGVKRIASESTDPLPPSSVRSLIQSIDSELRNLHDNITEVNDTFSIVLTDEASVKDEAKIADASSSDLVNTLLSMRDRIVEARFRLISLVERSSL